MLSKRRWEYRAEATPAARARPSADLGGATPMPSPARMLQQQLELQAIAAFPPELEKWSQRRRLAFLVASASSLWLAVLAAGTGAVHLVG